MSAFLLIVFIIFFQACAAQDLGDATPIEVEIASASNPTWDGGIGELMQKKCANCHIATEQRSKFVPSDVPEGFVSIDTIGEEDFFAILNSPAKTGRVYTVFLRTFHDAEDPMPPDFSTPLSTNEKTAFANYLQNLGVDYDEICPTTQSELTYEDVKSVIDANCATSGCHPASGANYPLVNFAQNKFHRFKSLGYLAAYYMPLNSTVQEFVDSEDGLQLREWLCAGEDLESPN